MDTPDSTTCDSDTVVTKFCHGCQSMKSIDEFSTNKRRKDGKQTRCKACNRAYRLAHVEHEREYRNTYRVRYMAEHGEARREAERARYRANPDKKRNYHAAHRDVRLEYLRQYRKSDHGKAVVRANNHKRRAREGGRGKFTPAEIADLRVGQTDDRGNVRCWWCGKVMNHWHIDHVIPISRGGKNETGNLCLSCPHCNISKHNRLPQEWAGRLF